MSGHVNKLYEMYRHIILYDWNIVDCHVKQPIHLTPPRKSIGIPISHTSSAATFHSAFKRSIAQRPLSADCRYTCIGISELAFGEFKHTSEWTLGKFNIFILRTIRNFHRPTSDSFHGSSSTLLCHRNSELQGIYSDRQRDFNQNHKNVVLVC